MAEQPDDVANVLDSLTMGELIELEEYTGIPLDQLGQPGAMKGKSSVFMAHLLMRRKDPTSTIADALALTPGEMAEVLDVDPTKSTSGE